MVNLSILLALCSYSSTLLAGDGADLFINNHGILNDLKIAAEPAEANPCDEGMGEFRDCLLRKHCAPQNADGTPDPRNDLENFLFCPGSGLKGCYMRVPEECPPWVGMPCDTDDVCGGAMVCNSGRCIIDDNRR